MSDKERKLDYSDCELTFVSERLSTNSLSHTQRQKKIMLDSVMF